MTTTSGYVIFNGPLRTEFCVLGFMQGFADDYKLMKGHAVSAVWPDDVSFHMDADFKKRIKLSDNLVNANDFLIASDKLQAFFKAEAVPQIECLPVVIFNHKKKAEPASYAIVNPLAVVDCIDHKASVVTWNSIVTENIDAVRKLALDESKIDRSLKLFRVKGLVDLIFFRRDLADKLRAQQFTGLEFKEIEKFAH